MLVGRNQEALNEQARKIRDTGGKCIVVPTDVTKSAEVNAMVKNTLDEFGKVDILVNNAGVTGPIETPIWEVKEEDWDYTLAVNLKGIYLCCKAVLHHMIERKSGNIVNIAGTSGRTGYPMRSPYSSSKWAVVGLTKVTAIEAGPYGIRVNAIHPGGVVGPGQFRMKKIIETRAKLKKVSTDEVVKGYLNETVIGRWITDDEIGEAVLFLVTKATATTGWVLDCSGGWFIGPIRRGY